MRKNIRDFADIHHHLQPGESNCDESRIANINYDADIPSEGYISIGIHPWSTVNMSESDFTKAIETVSEKASDQRVIAIGECGIDRLRGGNIDFQEKVFRAQVELSEQFKLPLIIHAVRATDIILKIKKEMQPTQLWIIHGFRGKKETALHLIRQGIALSLGKKSKLEISDEFPPNMIFKESDED